ncbi:MAG: hypothetical protein WD851_19970 [Pirellulales bacterium]
MKRSRNGWGWSIAWIVAIIPLLGCSDSKKPVPSVPTATNPAASFERVVENLRHYLDQLQDQPLTAIDNGAFSDFRVSREVIGHEFTPPANPGGEYRGNITVATRWSHSYRPPRELPSEKSDEKQDSEESTGNQTAGDTIQDGIQVLDSEVIAGLEPSVKRVPSALLRDSVGKSDSDEERKTFQFAFRNRRWELAAQPSTESGAPNESGVPSSDSTDGEEGTLGSSSNFSSLDNAVMQALRLQ